MVRRLEVVSRKKYVDHRNWPEYNEQLVVRGKFYLDFSFVKNWDKELERMNKGKEGAPYKFPDSYIKWLSVWKQWTDYRSLEGISRALAAQGIIPAFQDYTATWNRIHDFIPAIRLPSYKDLNTATDLTCMNPKNGGQYLEFKYGRKGRRKSIVVVITVDVKHKKLLRVEAYVEGEGPTEPDLGMKQNRELIEKGYDIYKHNADGKYDNNKTFDFWDKRKTKLAIPPRKNAKIRRTKSKRRKKEIRIFRRLGFRRWYQVKNYGDRLAAEGEHSGVKRKFGENLVSRLENSLCAEAIQRFWAYDMLKDYGVGIV